MTLGNLADSFTHFFCDELDEVGVQKFMEKAASWLATSSVISFFVYRFFRSRQRKLVCLTLFNPHVPIDECRFELGIYVEVGKQIRTS